jgi:hypothetical protein
MFPPVTIGPQTFTTEVVTDENDTHFLVEGDEGGIDYETGTIYLRPQAADRMHATWQHEIVHAAFDASGIDYLVACVAKKMGVEAEDLTEIVVRMLTPALATVLCVRQPVL